MIKRKGPFFAGCAMLLALLAGFVMLPNTSSSKSKNAPKREDYADCVRVGQYILHDVEEDGRRDGKVDAIMRAGVHHALFVAKGYEEAFNTHPNLTREMPPEVREAASRALRGGADLRYQIDSLYHNQK